MDERRNVCARHDVETRLRCSSCETFICPDCWHDAAVGYHCPDCAQARSEAAERTAARIAGGQQRDRPSGSSAQTSTALGLRAGSIGLAAAVVGGLLLGPVLVAGTFFLISAGVIGWLVARTVYWAAEETSTPLIRAVALTLAGFSVAVGFLSSSVPSGPSGLAMLAFPAALWGGWIVVRQR